MPADLGNRSLVLPVEAEISSNSSNSSWRRFRTLGFDILVCPLCKGNLEYRKSAQELVCKPCRLAYPVRDDIPVMLEDLPGNWGRRGMKFRVVVPARYASTRLPGKAAARSGRQNPWWFGWLRARNRSSEVWVATDHPAVREAAEAHGIPVVMTQISPERY